MYQTRRPVFLFFLFILASVVPPGCGAAQEAAQGQVAERTSLPKIEPAGKVFILGLDGADWKIVDRLEKEGRIPNLARIRREGASGVLLSEQPLLSPIVWTTIATGRHPLDHGVVGFLTVRDGATEPVRSDERQVRSFWNVATDYGLSVGVIGWYVSWPAEKVNGYMISDRVGYHQVPGDAEAVETALAYPPSLMGEVSGIMERVEEGIGANAAARFFTAGGEAGKKGASVAIEDDRLQTFIGVIRTTELYRALLPRMTKRFDPDITAVYFEGTDSVGHLFAEFADRPLAGVDPEAVKHMGDTFYRFYEYIDTVVGEMIARLDPAVSTLIVVSDHGFKTGDARPGVTGRSDHGDQAPLWHRPEGVVMMWGRGVRKGVRLPDASIYDVMPTVCRSVGLPVADNLPGRVMEEAFKPGAFPSSPAKVDDYDARGPREKTVVDVELPADDELARLRALGYVGEATESGASRDEGQDGVPVNRYNRGVVLLNSGRKQEALQVFRSLQEQSPQFALGFLGEGLVYLQDRNPKEAEKVLVRALKLGNEFGAIHEALGEAYVATGDAVAAERSLRKALELNPSDGRAALILARLRMIKRDHDEARSLFETARVYAEKPEDRADGCVGLAILAEEGRAFDAAASLYAEALRNNENFPRALERYANLELYRKKPQRAIPLLARLVELRPDNAAIAALHGQALAQAGRFAEARAELNRSLDLDENQPEVRALLERLPTDAS